MNKHFEHLFNEEIYVLEGHDSTLSKESTQRTFPSPDATVSTPEKENPPVSSITNESVEDTPIPEINVVSEVAEPEKVVSNEPVAEEIAAAPETEKQEPVAEETPSHLKVVLTNATLDESDIALLEKILAAIKVGKDDYVINVISSSDEVPTSSYLFYFNEKVSDCVPNGTTGIMAPSLKKLATDTSQKQKLWGYMKDLLLG